IVLGLVTNILLLPLSQGWEQWLPGVKSQMAQLLALPSTRPIIFAIGVVVFIALTVAGYFANQAAKRDEEIKSKHRKEAIAHHVIAKDVKEPLTQLVAEVTTVRHGVEQLTQQQVELLTVPPNVIAPTGIPRAVSFVGREHERAELLRKLRA